MSAPQATSIRVQWSDGLIQRFERQPDGTWTLAVTGSQALDGGPRVTGYRRGDLERVLVRVIRDTPEGSIDDVET